MGETYITEEQREKCRKVAKAFAELDYEEIFETFPEEKKREIIRKREQFLSLCKEQEK